MELAILHPSAHPEEVPEVDLVPMDMVFAVHSHSVAAARAARTRPTSIPRPPSEPASAQLLSVRLTRTFVSSESTSARLSSPARTPSLSPIPLSPAATQSSPAA